MHFVENLKAVLVPLLEEDCLRSTHEAFLARERLRAQKLRVHQREGQDRKPELERLMDGCEGAHVSRERGWVEDPRSDETEFILFFLQGLLVLSLDVSEVLRIDVAV